MQIIDLEQPLLFVGNDNEIIQVISDIDGKHSVTKLGHVAGDRDWMTI